MGEDEVDYVSEIKGANFEESMDIKELKKCLLKHSVLLRFPKQIETESLFLHADLFLHVEVLDPITVIRPA